MFELIIASVKLILLVGGLFLFLGIVLAKAASSGKETGTGRTVAATSGAGVGAQEPVKKASVRLPKEFEYALQFFVKFCASWGSSSGVAIDVVAYTQGEKKGTVELGVRGESRWKSCVARDIPELLGYIFGNQGSGYMTRGLSFYEPDCYIYGCPPEAFEQYDVRGNAPNAYVKSYNKFADYIYYTIGFNEAEDDYAAYNQFVEWCKKSCYSYK